MVLVVILCHGRYGVGGESDVRVPYNIRLIQYTNPRVNLSNNDTFYILNQLIGYKGESHNASFFIKPELLDLEINDTSIAILSPPYVKIKAMPRPYPNDRRFIGKIYEPQGKFKIYEPYSKTPNISLAFANEPKRTKDQILLETKMLKQTKKGSQTEYYKVDTPRRSIKEWLDELSSFYEVEYPGKVINVIQLSCRSDTDATYTSVDELADELEAKWRPYKNVDDTIYSTSNIDYRPGFEGTSRSEVIAARYNDNTQFDFIHKNPPLILKKSDDVKPPPVVVRISDGGRKSRRKRGRRKSTRRKRISRNNKRKN